MKICCNLLKTALIILIFLPIFVHGQIVITEIMYDLAEGSDTGREWVEISNNSENPINLASWIFFENNQKHGLNVLQGNEILLSGKSAIIVDNFEKFKINWPNFSETIFKSTFSLNNTGETIAIKNSNLNEIDSVTYTSDWGAKGDGNSLQKTSSGWKAGSPTPGTSDFITNSTNSSQATTTTTTATTTSQTTQQQNFTSPAFEPQIFAYAGEDRIVIVGADTIFDAKAIGIKNEPIENALFTWNFGDGSFQKGKKIMHSYNYPGKYVVFLEASSGEYSVTDRISVIALPADIVISNISRDADKNFIELHNRTNRELNLSWWRLQVDNNFFTLQKNTVMLPNEKIIFSKNVTNLNITNQSKINLLYPNGSLVTSFGVGASKVFQGTTVLNEEPQLKITGVTRPTSNGAGTKQGNSVSLPAVSSYGINENISNVKVISDEAKKIEAKDYSASVVNSDLAPKTAENGGIFKWIVGLSSIILLSIIGFVFVKKEPMSLDEKEKNEIQKISDEIKIIE